MARDAIAARNVRGRGTVNSAAALHLKKELVYQRRRLQRMIVTLAAHMDPPPERRGSGYMRRYRPRAAYPSARRFPPHQELEVNSRLPAAGRRPPWELVVPRGSSSNSGIDT